MQFFPSEHSYDLISSGDKTLEVWKEGKLVKSLQHSNDCWRFHLNSDKSLLAVGYDSGVTVWSTAAWTRLADLEIGDIMDVKFNSASNVILAAQWNGKLHIVNLD